MSSEGRARPPAATLHTVEGAPLLLWRFPAPLLAVSSAVYGGGLGTRHWVLNATVPSGYDRSDPEGHVAELAGELGLDGVGSGLLTAVDVRHEVTATESGIRAGVTTGVGQPVWAAHEGADTPSEVHVPGTINAVCFCPVRLKESALVNLVSTVAEAKTQALVEAGVPGTGTCTDATVVVCPADGDPEPYGGPRSAVGAPLARAVHRAVSEGLRVDGPGGR
ncbi:adenosylcobinamide amidohydrolase [Actinopolyspora mortivallis]|uniref:Adenosylcobinamide amidohydrolase n=1 Tax=Actinopolyspora mortivallis TaxID=33906 RepID=A0A2T0GTM6_ACTMO|nr:adenosylcobinamide amidohydrolase [Actinopolyspora mortivallis]PRW62451.1 adenosylcobinamide amidohydrolase [Actinopolyspora mortivallis]